MVFCNVIDVTVRNASGFYFATQKMIHLKKNRSCTVVMNLMWGQSNQSLLLHFDGTFRQSFSKTGRFLGFKSWLGTSVFLKKSACFVYLLAQPSPRPNGHETPKIRFLIWSPLFSHIKTHSLNRQNLKQNYCKHGSLFPVILRRSLSNPCCFAAPPLSLSSSLSLSLSLPRGRTPQHMPCTPLTRMRTPQTVCSQRWQEILAATY